jgi:hypothetical protein
MQELVPQNEGEPMFDFPFYLYDADGRQAPLTSREKRAVLLVGVAIALGTAALLIAIGIQSSA